MAIADNIARTLTRIGSIANFLSGSWVRKVWAGLAEEFGRVAEYKDLVACATVPSDQLCVEALDDLERKYGIDSFGDFTDAERIQRIEERATCRGAGGWEWLQQQVQAAGFPLYVIENVKNTSEETQMGEDTQMKTTTQMSMLPSRIDPSTVPGILIVSSPNGHGGRVVAEESMMGTAQMGEDTKMGTPNEDYSYPQPLEFSSTIDATAWGKVFFLSPIEGRVATESELLYISDEKMQYLKKLIIEIKFLRNWCIAQVAIS